MRFNTVYIFDSITASTRRSINLIKKSKSPPQILPCERSLVLAMVNSIQIRYLWKGPVNKRDAILTKTKFLLVNFLYGHEPRLLKSQLRFRQFLYKIEYTQFSYFVTVIEAIIPIGFFFLASERAFMTPNNLAHMPNTCTHVPIDGIVQLLPQLIKGLFFFCAFQCPYQDFISTCAIAHAKPNYRVASTPCGSWENYGLAKFLHLRMYRRTTN